MKRKSESPAESCEPKRRKLCETENDEESQGERNLPIRRNPTDSDEGANFDLLPTEILLHIFSCVSIQDLMVVAKVCKKWHIVSQDRVLWKELTISNCKVTTETVCFLLKKAPFLKFLKITDRDDISDILDEVRYSNTELETLIINKCGDEKYENSIDFINIHRLASKCTKLENLSIENTHVYFDEWYNIDDLRWPKLEKAVFATDFPSWVCYDDNIDFDARFSLFVSNLSESLRYLEFDAYIFTAKAMEAVVRCKNLTTLVIHSPVRINDDGFLMISQLERLNSLKITFAHWISTAAWLDLMSHPTMSGLTEFEVSDTETFSDVVIDVMEINCPYIEELSIINCKNVKNTTATKIEKGFRYLNDLEFMPYA